MKDVSAEAYQLFRACFKSAILTCFSVILWISAGDCLALEKLLKFLKMIDFGHTLFGLPFAYLGAFLCHGGPHSEPAGGGLLLAMISARTSALCPNRIIDRHLIVPIPAPPIG